MVFVGVRCGNRVTRVTPRRVLEDRWGETRSLFGRADGFSRFHHATREAIVIVCAAILPGGNMAARRRTTHRSSKGKKLYAVRDKGGQFKDIQTYERAHAADIRRKSKSETAAKAGKKKKKAAKKKGRKKKAARKKA
jgi:hypothetical protein